MRGTLTLSALQQRRILHRRGQFRAKRRAVDEQPDGEADDQRDGDDPRAINGQEHEADD